MRLIYRVPHSVCDDRQHKEPEQSQPEASNATLAAFDEDQQHAPISEGDLMNLNSFIRTLEMARTANLHFDSPDISNAVSRVQTNLGAAAEGLEGHRGASQWADRRAGRDVVRMVRGGRDWRAAGGAERPLFSVENGRPII